LNFEVESKQTGELSIYSCEGKIVYSGILVDGKQVELLNSGIYVMRMMLNNQIIIRKVAVK